MAQARLAPVAARRIVLVSPPGLAATAIAALAARGLRAARVEHAEEVPADDDVIVAWVLGAMISGARAGELAALAGRAAAEGRPPCVLAPLLPASAAIEHAAALALLRAHGAAVVHDVDAWLEAIVLLARIGMPAGPRVALIAPPGSWLEAQGRALAAEAEQLGARAALVEGDDPTDVVLHDAALPAPPLDRLARVTAPPLQVPVVARGELGDGGAALVGLRAALGAVLALGRAGERVAVGIGPEPRTAGAGLEIDQERLRRQLDKLGPGDRRLGDHETKVLLAAYGVPITRQAVATTPSAAVKIAQRAGFPVELKPWGHDLPPEPACPVERDVKSAALVRRAFAAVLTAAGRGHDEAQGAAVIVRQAPPTGRELAVRIVRLPGLGFTVFLDAPGAPIAAAPAPLRPLDAAALAATPVASRVGEGELDRAGLASLLHRASHLVVELDARLGARVSRLVLPRVLVGGRGARALVIDAALELDG